MNGFYEQINTVLTNPPGSIAFYLVLVFSALSAFQVVLMISREIFDPYKTRLLIGLGVLLIAQSALFLLTAFTWQTPATAHLLLPPIDRTLTLISMIAIGWLWAFPASQRAADISVLLIGSIVVVFGVFSYLFWINQSETMAFNSSQLDLIWNILSVLILLIDCGAIITEKSDTWYAGLYFGLVNLAGYSLHFIAASPNGDLTASVRLTQLLTFPILPLLARRILSKQQPHEEAWPLITRIESDDDIFTQTGSPVTFTTQVETNAQEEINRLHYRLSEATDLLNEANNRIDKLEAEKRNLSESKPVPIPVASTSTVSENSSAIPMLASALCQPLNSIIATATLINAEGVGVLGTLQRNFLNEIINKIQIIVSRLEELQDDPAMFNKPGHLFPGPDLNGGIDAAIASMNSPIRAKSITLRLDIPEFTRPMIISPNVLEQILVNLLQNAVLVSPPEATIGLTLEEKQDELGRQGMLIEVTDVGGGVGLKNIEKIFIKKQGATEPKYRGIGSLSNLHLAKTMVDVYNGKIWLACKGKQTTFSVFIPF